MPLAKYTRFRYITASQLRDDSDIVVILSGVPGVTGPQGPTGSPGTPGTRGATGVLMGSKYEYVQSDPQSVWMILHNMGCYPYVVVFDENGVDVEGDITYGSENQLTITFNTPVAGRAELSIVVVKDASAGAFEFIQHTPSSTWMITHNLGFNPNVTAFDENGVDIEFDIDYISLDELTLTFNSPVAGTAECS